MHISSIVVCASLAGFTVVIFPFSLQTATLVSMNSREVCLPAKHTQVGDDTSHVISRWHVNILGRGYS